MHDLYRLSNPCNSSLVKGTIESAKRSFSAPVVKKEPMTPNMIFSTCQNLHQRMLICLIYALLLFVLQLSLGFYALMNWLSYAVEMLSSVKINMLSYS